MKTIRVAIRVWHLPRAGVRIPVNGTIYNPRAKGWINVPAYKQGYPSRNLPEEVYGNANLYNRQFGYTK